MSATGLRVLPRCFHRYPESGIGGPWMNAFWEPYPDGVKMRRSDGTWFVRSSHFDHGVPSVPGRSQGLHMITLLDDVVLLDRRLRPTPTITQLLDALGRQLGGTFSLVESPATGASAFVAQARSDRHGTLPVLCAGSCALVRHHGSGIEFRDGRQEAVELTEDVVGFGDHPPRVALDWSVMWEPVLSFGPEQVIAHPAH